MVFLGKCLRALEKNVYSTLVGESVLEVSVGSAWMIMCSVSSLGTCPLVLPITEKGANLTVIVGFRTSPCTFIRFASCILMVFYSVCEGS